MNLNGLLTLRALAPRCTVLARDLEHGARNVLTSQVGGGPGGRGKEAPSTGGAPSMVWRLSKLEDSSFSALGVYFPLQNESFFSVRKGKKRLRVKMTGLLGMKSLLDNSFFLR